MRHPFNVLVAVLFSFPGQNFGPGPRDPQKMAKIHNILFPVAVQTIDVEPVREVVAQPSHFVFEFVVQRP